MWGWTCFCLLFGRFFVQFLLKWLFFGVSHVFWRTPRFFPSVGTAIKSLFFCLACFLMLFCLAEAFLAVPVFWQVLEFFLGFGNGCFGLGVSFGAKISVFTVKRDVFIGFPCFSSFPFFIRCFPSSFPYFPDYCKVS